MRRPALLVAVTLTACTTLPSASPRIEPVIFGTDDRVEVYEVRDNALREAVVRAVPAMIRAGSVNIDEATGRVTFSTRSLGSANNLCPGEAHFAQPTAPSCSATLIDDDLVLTAGHCVSDWACADQRFVFGWYYDAAGMLHMRERADVFSCAEVLVTENTLTNDYAIVRLDRPAPGPPMAVRMTPVLVTETVSLAGYPFGLPMKVVEGGEVTGIVSRSRFYARLDAHPGNSGSGVYDSELRVLGDLTNGPVTALVEDGTCNRLAVIGEDTVRTELISSVIPAVEALCATGHVSARLCPVCGDGMCVSGETCIEDCGAPPDAAIDAAIRQRDAGPRIVDAATYDAARADDAAALPDALAAPDAHALPDAGPAITPGTCGCRTQSHRDAHAGWVLAALGVLLVMRRRHRR